ncbi:MAG TPA: R3H domain-containing nucleic acid-binding protein [Kiritimatiellia bacterium]|nr:R3H domain-containing nucleic acid-binding protein [Kiritimatiellia bacterium]HRZ11432.1 R3H domain-containing nucleic acid-binding protein [Kiritimatiellia bacterium]HSA17017.1 R3H domain-containing nucleic acid-binding protein [Kiritimatiellia bacterium]
MSDQDTLSQVQDEARQTLGELLRLTGFDAKVEASAPAEQEVLLRIECSDAAQLIGRKGQVLDALQFILGRMLLRKAGRDVHFVVDVGDYRERRKEQVLREAMAAIEEVRKTGRPVKLPVMSAHERRLVHHLAAETPGLETFSEPTGEEGRKRVVISPVGESAPPA